jgi:adenylate kinase family enzyme
MHQRFVVVGVTGSGKSTFASRLAERLCIPYIELDALHWGPNWTHASDEAFRARVEAATSAPAWVADGNYSLSRDILWRRAEVILWLDYPLGLVFGRLWRRTWSRWWSRELLWGINREPLLVQFKFWSDESLFRWLFKTYGRRKRLYPQLFRLPEYSHLEVFQFHSPRQAEDWMSKQSG